MADRKKPGPREERLVVDDDSENALDKSLGRSPRQRIIVEPRPLEDIEVPIETNLFHCLVRDSAGTYPINVKFTGLWVDLHFEHAERVVKQAALSLDLRRAQTLLLIDAPGGGWTAKAVDAEGNQIGPLRTLRLG